MIIRIGSKHPITRTDKPNENWLADDSYIVVDDNSNLGRKILQNAPYYIEVKNERGVLIDITPTERPAAPPSSPSETELLQQDVGALLLESAADKAKIADLETLTGALLLEIATLKGGVA